MEATDSRLAKIATDIADLSAEEETISARQYAVRCRLHELHTEKYHIETEQHSFDGWDQTTISQLAQLTDPQIRFLFLKTGRRDPTLVQGESAISAEQYSKAITRMMYSDMIYGACTYCKLVMHSKYQCPALLKKTCSACHMQGHDMSHCTMTMKDYQKMQRSKHAQRA